MRVHKPTDEATPLRSAGRPVATAGINWPTVASRSNRSQMAPTGQAGSTHRRPQTMVRVARR
eukprot:11161673-Lingulodinium_polyedra.AAC.1